MSSKNTGNNHGVEVLIAEDSLTQAEQLRHLLEEHGFSVRAVSNGTEALAAARERRPTVIISDIVMPEMDGYDLCKAVKSDEVLKDTPVVLLTSLSSPQDVIEALKSGADNFIRKPYDERHLLLRVEHIIANRRLRESDKVKVGVELYLGGERHFITAERQQILDLLISTYEQAVQLCRELQMREEELDRANTMLTGIYRIAKGLNSAATESEIVEQVLRNALDLPDVRAGWISLFDPASGFQLVGSRGLPPALAQPGVIEGDCLCRQKFLEGDIIRATNITECERLQKAKGETLGLRSHVTIPLHVGTRPLGILNLVGSEQVMFSENDLTILNGIGNQIGVALERCRMHEHLEERVRQRTAALTAEIAERARAEDALRTTEAQLIQAQKMESIGSLAGGIAHDFNNILGIILGHASIIQGSSGGVENVFPSIDAINRSVVRGAGLVRQLLTFARKTEKTIETVRLNDLIEELIKMLTETFPKTITIARYLDADLPPIGADANQLHQVLLNLAVNGRDAMPDGGTLSFHTRVLTGDELRHRFPDAEHNAYVSVHVSDTGVGMDTETQRRIFEPFFTTKGPGKGTGLGMSVVYGVVTG
ncbi:MAG: response regulator, partial [Ignavibacteriae bacterium]|nr:response regulator [Ignavibacteriota bacterium]